MWRQLTLRTARGRPERGVAVGGEGVVNAIDNSMKEGSNEVVHCDKGPLSSAMLC